MDLVVREIEKSDVADCCEIYNYYIVNTTNTLENETLTVDKFWKRVVKIKERYPYIVCADNNRVVGYAYLSPLNERFGYRYTCDVSIYVDVSHRGSGVGKALMKEILSLGEKINICEVIAVITDENENSKAFHSKMGFKTVGVLENVANKHGRTFNVVYMQKKIKELPF